MGFRNSWVAVRGPLASLVKKAGFTESWEEYDLLDTGLFGLELENGWSLVIGSGWDAMDKVREGLAARMGRALYLTQEDSSMGAMIVGYVDGHKRWSVVYDGSNGVGTPEFEGEVPAEAAEIWARCQAEQRKHGAGVDSHYELVPELGKALTGFRHDEDPPDGALFRVIEE